MPPIRPTTAGRPARPAAGPPGLAALVDAERSALREHLDRRRALEAAALDAQSRAEDVEVATRRQASGPPAGGRGLRDRYRPSPQQSRLLLADLRTSANAATAALEAARQRTLASERRLSEIRALIDGLDLPDRAPVDAIRREPELPPQTESFASIGAFIDARPGRATGDRRIEDLIGRPLGDRWVLEDPDRPWERTRWRAAWSCDGEAPLGELYAVELVLRAHPVRRVHVLGVAQATPRNAHRVEAALALQGSRNSLAALAAVAVALD